MTTMTTSGRIYFDYHATTPVDTRVAEVVNRFMLVEFGNASSDHTYGDSAAEAVRVASNEVLALLGADEGKVVFTSGATESVNVALQSLAWISASRTGIERIRIALTPIEHPAVLETCRSLAEDGQAELVFLNVDRRGQLDLYDVESCCESKVDVVCVMAANNEIGTILPIQEVATIAHRHGALLLCDATQAAGKIPVRAREWGIDLLALSAHKMYGPKGVGALLTLSPVPLRRVIHGGHQQGGLRAGTLNVPGIAGLGEACRLRRLEMAGDETRVAQLRDNLERRLLNAIPSLVVNGDTNRRLAGNLHISIPGVPNQAIIARVRRHLAIATGSACQSGAEGPSHVLKAINLADDLQAGALRMGLGKYSTQSEVDLAANLLASAVQDARAALEAGASDGFSALPSGSSNSMS